MGVTNHEGLGKAQPTPLFTDDTCRALDSAFRLLTAVSGTPAAWTRGVSAGSTRATSTPTLRDTMGRRP